MILTKHPLIRTEKLVTHLGDLFQKLKPFDIVVPLDSEPVGYWFQTLPHFLQAPADNPLPLITAKKVSRQNTVRIIKIIRLSRHDSVNLIHTFLDRQMIKPLHTDKQYVLLLYTPCLMP